MFVNSYIRIKQIDIVLHRNDEGLDDVFYTFS